MKRFFTALLVLAALSVQAQSPVIITKLPQKAQDFLLENFPEAVVNASEKGFLNYQVFLSNGVKATFLWTGGWTILEGPAGNIPSTVLPAVVAVTVADSYPGAQIIYVKNEGGSFSLVLDNGIQMLVSANGQLLGYSFVKKS